jgi:MarR family transcriptional regulator for hemolysin
LRLQKAAVAFDARLRNGVAETDIDVLGKLLRQLSGNVGGTDEGAAPWAGLAEPTAKQG